MSQYLPTLLQTSRTKTSSRVFQFDETAAKKNVKADFALMCALSAPYADEEALRMMVDWHNWVSNSAITLLLMRD